LEQANEIILGECARDKEEGVKLVLYTKNLTFLVRNGKSTEKKEEVDVESVRV